jgi:superfamily I DNA and/or RNA helicase
MHSVLGGFVSKYFYEAFGDPPILPGRDDSELAHGIDGYEGKVAGWLSVPFQKGGERRRQRKSVYRPEEASRIASELARLFELRHSYTFGVVSFYRAQVFEIWMELEKLGLATQEGEVFTLIPRLRYVGDETGRQAERLQLGTVDSFQGKEFDVVILSLTRSNSLAADPTKPAELEAKYGHLTLINRLCVAMSRQKRLLIVAGDPQMAITAPIEDRNLAPLRAFWELCGEAHGCIR